ncbi:alpha/beta hydrolase family protein [Nonomuraea sp. NPDC004354]
MSDHLWHEAAVVGRRGLLGGAAALAAALALPAPAATALAAGPPRLKLPVPTGPHDVGTIALHLVDRGRRDPWKAARPRELMISVWYPAACGAGGRHRPAPWMTTRALARYRTMTAEGLRRTAERLDLGGVDISLDGVGFPLTHAREGVQVRAGRRCPVVLYSSGAGEPRAVGTTLVEDLASRGYVVVTIDHTHDAWAVEFPGGRVERDLPPLDRNGAQTAVKVRVADTRFVLDALAALAAGRNPDAAKRALPAGLAGCLDLDRIGMFGHSLGGATTGQSMAHDARIRAGLDLDGHVIPTVSIAPPMPPERAGELAGQVATRIGDRPFMIMSSAGKGPDELGALMAGFWSHLRGRRWFLSLKGSTHASYTDDKQLIHQLATAKVIPAALTEPVGTIAPGRCTAAQRAYVAAFFDRCLRERDAPLLDGPSAKYPEIVFFPST